VTTTRLKYCVVCCGTLFGAIVHAQIPDVRVKFDLRTVIRADEARDPQIRFYDVQGTHSTVAFTFRLEPGFRAFVAQRLERFPHDADTSLVDEAYIEDEGIWRVGKQYLPFGSGRILRESVPAARADTNLIIEGLPVSVAACDGGTNYTRGVIGRLGSRIGASFAFGRHFGIAGTAFTQFRHPEDSVGRSRGYRQALGVDAERTYQTITVKGEAIALRDGETPRDPNLEIVDLAGSFRFARESYGTVGYTAVTAGIADVLRIGATVRLDARSSLEPMLRFSKGKVYDFSVAWRFRF
jgi:hypothetical protein